MGAYDRKDHFYQKAKSEGYPARSAYKLLEMDKKFGILRPGTKIVDLGSAPGGWLKVAEEKTQNIIGIDLLPLQYNQKPTTIFIKGDFLHPENQQKMIRALGGKAHWVLSDLSPNLSGIKFKDTLASIELCKAALEFSKKILAGGGSLVMKVFPGPELHLFQKELQSSFKKTTFFIPEATRKTSDEIYWVALEFFKGHL